MQLKEAVGARMRTGRPAKLHIDVQFSGRISNIWRVATGRPELAEDRDNCPAEECDDYDKFPEGDAQGGSSWTCKQLAREASPRQGSPSAARDLAHSVAGTSSSICTTSSRSHHP